MPREVENEQLPEVAVPDIDRVIQTALFHKTCSAAACIASVGGRVFHRKVYGNPTLPPPVRRLGYETLFDLGALTQPLGSGLATLVLVSRNRLDLNASLDRTIRELKDPRFAKITIDMLLDHTSGLPAERSFLRTLREEEEGKRGGPASIGTEEGKRRVRSLLSELRVEYEPGSQVRYAPLGFLVLGFILEDLVGKPLDVFLAREVFRPLGLAEDLFFVRLDDERHRARLRRRVFAAGRDDPDRGGVLQGEVDDPNAWAVGGVAGHAGLFGTVDAVWRLVHALWQSHRGEDRHFLGGTVRRFWTRSRRLRDTTRTLAWETPSAIAPTVGKRFSPASVGFTSLQSGAIWIDLSTDVIGVLLLNASHPTPEGKEEALQKLIPRVFDFIAKHGESIPQDDKAVGSRAFYDGPIAAGTSLPLHNPLQGPRK